jgi:hypothetical protein
MFVQGGLRRMTEHVNVVLNLSGKYYQAVCTCGWTSSTSYFEEIDLLRAIHAHEVVALGIGP